MYELRCKKCKALLMKAEIVEGEIEIKCRKCGLVNRRRFTSAKNDGNFAINDEVIYNCSL